MLHSRFLWKYHRTHHEKREPVWQDTYHAHWAEGFVQSIGFALPFAFGYPIISWQMFAALCFCQLRGLMRHDARTVWLIGNHHLLHHIHPKYNYGEYWLDKLFRTNWKLREDVQKGLVYV